MLFRPRAVPSDLSVFDGLPVRRIAVGEAGEQMAVHVSGAPMIGRPPLLCVPGYQRNMLDFTGLLDNFHHAYGVDQPVVLVDLKGRGRSSDRADKSKYVSTLDARDLSQLCAALGIESAIFLGQGFGGQVIMALAAQHPTLIAGAVLIDAGPVSDPRGLVRLRNNLKHLEGLRNEAGLHTMFRRMLATDYPGLSDGMLDVLAARTHYIDKRQRVRTLFDPQLIRNLEAFEHDDVLMAQWGLFNAMASMPLMLMRTQLTDQLRREVFEEMLRRRRDADGYIIEGQASPALLNSRGDVEPIAEFVRRVIEDGERPRSRAAAV
jgi:pimeloyl-ACP methyl ester carboxylesterase